MNHCGYSPNCLREQSLDRTKRQGASKATPNIVYYKGVWEGKELFAKQKAPPEVAARGPDKGSTKPSEMKTRCYEGVEHIQTTISNTSNGPEEHETLTGGYSLEVKHAKLNTYTSASTIKAQVFVNGSDARTCAIDAYFRVGPRGEASWPEPRPVCPPDEHPWPAKVSLWGKKSKEAWSSSKNYLVGTGGEQLQSTAAPHHSITDTQREFVVERRSPIERIRDESDFPRSHGPPAVVEY
ncbi:hypothetical protein BDZ97DRAFT_1756234 [Flammula alnicola]|nr:hypothetical protein BDZ97DRAFT_1756234 [Flammula alnicola]